eukprot:SAG31_NODE_4508_length_3178_cov_14.175706_3_plen_275_part_00
MPTHAWTIYFDQVDDGEAAMRFLTERGVLTKHILLHGHSLGGAVAVSVRARHPGGPVVNDRSFGTLAAVIVVHPFLQGRGGVVPTVLCALAGGLFVPVALVLHGNGGGSLWSLPLPLRSVVACLVGVGIFRLFAALGKRDMMGWAAKRAGEKWAHPENLDLWGQRKMMATIGVTWLVASSFFAWLMPTFIGTLEYTLAGIITGVIVGRHTDFLQNVAPSLLRLLGWKFNIAKLWSSQQLEDSPKLLLYHKQDLVIPVTYRRLVGCSYAHDLVVC